MDEQRKGESSRPGIREETIEEILIRRRSDYQSRIDDINMVLTIIAGKPELVEMHKLMSKAGV